MAKIITPEYFPNLVTVILAGGGLKEDGSIEGKYLIEDETGRKEHKCFAQIKGKPVVQYTLDALYELDFRNILLECNENYVKKLNLESRVKIIPDAGGLKKNIINIIKELEKILKSKEDPVLILYGDKPFFNSEALINSLEKCDLEAYDAFHIMPTKESLDPFSKFYSRYYIHFKEFLGRLSGLTLGRPLKSKNISLVGDFYGVIEYDKKKEELLKQKLKESFDKESKTVSNKRLIISALRHGGLRGLVSISNHLVTAYSYRWGFKEFSEYLRAKSPFSPVKQIEKVISNIFGCRFKIIPSPYGELAMDNDQELEFNSFLKNWDEILKVIDREHKKSNNLY
jgi:CTP:molybdopterin cytidylyltransferase MocA